ncbi:hypothetical protein, partial [Thiolapillus sp.]|uniref:hypothetical protein n=1 Tax=Thiolapillus sp. TaxID=2017437 RepID=UPI003AF76ECD
CADFLVKSGLIHRCLQFNQAEISGYWHPSGADMPLSGDLGNHDQYVSCIATCYKPVLLFG